MIVKVISDCHFMSPDPMDIKPVFGENVIWLADNHEFKYIRRKKKIIHEAIDEYEKFLDIARSTNTKVLGGNHERNQGIKATHGYSVIYDGAYFTHGHREIEGPVYADKWETGELGVGLIRLALAGPIMKARRVIFKRKEQKTDELDMISYAAIRNGCNIAVYGHTHPYKTLMTMHNGVLCINVAQGMTELDLDLLRSRFLS